MVHIQDDTKGKKSVYKLNSITVNVNMADGEKGIHVHGCFRFVLIHVDSK